MFRRLSRRLLRHGLLAACCLGCTTTTLPAAEPEPQGPVEDVIVVPDGARVPTQLLGSRSRPMRLTAERPVLEAATGARVMRATARAANAATVYGSGAAGVNADRVIRQDTDGVRQVCITQIGTSQTDGNARHSGDQIVVVQGTVINICR